jgi:hypothetical protein
VTEGTDSCRRESSLAICPTGICFWASRVVPRRPLARIQCQRQGRTQEQSGMSSIYSGNCSSLGSLHTMNAGSEIRPNSFGSRENGC